MNKKKGLILGIGLVVLCVAVAVAALLLRRKTAPQLAWNPDYQAMLDGTATRVPDETGWFSVRLWLDGQEVTYRTNDPKLIEQLDLHKVVQIEADKDGVLTSITAPAYTELANRDLVQRTEGNALLLNSSIAFNGSQKTLQLAKDCKIVDVSGISPSAAQLQIMDEVLIYGQDEATHIFVLHRELPAKLYWRLERKYDSKTKGTSRQPDENGVYTVLVAADGQQLELKCKDKAVVDKIDEPGTNAGAVGLSLDAEGYILQVQDVYKTIRGREICALYDVVSVEGDRFTAVNKQEGSTYGKTLEGQLAPDCEIYNINSSAIVKGERAESLQPGDRITAYGDAMGQVKYVYLHTRIMESALYFNLYRQYKGTDTTRQPDAAGWYVFELASDGKVVTVKTKEYEIAKEMDSFSSKGMGLILDGDVVKQAFGPNCVVGKGLLTSGREVRSITGAMITTGSGRSRVTPLMLHKDCKVYDVTGNPGTSLGEETQLQLGDHIYAFGTTDDEATHIFVTKRPLPEEQKP